MEKINLPTVTLIIVDCVQIDRAILSFEYCLSVCNFADSKILSSIPSHHNFVHKIPHIGTIKEYSHFMIENLSDYFDTEHVLIAQYDGCIWYKELWDNNFLNYDYIGAPWRPGLFPYFHKTYNVGNGGFSLRSKKLQEFLKNCENLQFEINGWPKNHSEDLVICLNNRKMLESNGFKFAPLSVAKNFSWENLPQSPAFGCHNRSVPERLLNWKLSRRL